MSADPPVLAGRRMPLWLILMGMLTAIGPLSIDMYLPSFPAIIADLQSSAGAIQRTLSTFFLGLALGQLVYGPLSDRFGRKPPLYVGLGVYGIAALGCAVAESALALQWWRFAQALGGCAGAVIARAVIRDRCDARTAAKAFSLIMLVAGLAPILAPLMGGLVLQWLGWRAIFVVLAVFGAMTLLAIHFAMQESLDWRHAAPLHPLHILRNYAKCLRDPQFLSYALCGGLASAGMFAYIAGSPVVLINGYKIAPSHYGWFFGTNAFGLIGASQINGRLLRYWSPAPVLGAALWLTAGAGIALAVLTLLGVTGLPILLPGLFVYVASLGLITPNSTALAMQHQGVRAGTASALMGALQLSLAAAASLAISTWQRESELPLTIVMAFCGTGAWLMYWLWARANTAD